MLMRIDEIKTALDRMYVPPELQHPRLRLTPPGIASDALSGLEASLRARFPDSYRRLIATYDFGDLTVGRVVFGWTGDYGAYLQEQNLHPEYPWWGGGNRPDY